jgi:ABC-type Fe3+ transport system substrate-binding protein
VNPTEFQSYWDLLTPKWKGKIVVSDPETGGVGTALRFFYHHPDLGPPFLRRLFGEMDVTMSRDARQIADWLASGKFAISMLASPTRLDLGVAKEQGLPVGWFGPSHFKEGAPLSAGSGFVYLPSRAPHPNAARVALNWLLSREGQLAAQRVATMRSPEGIDSLRIDIPKEHVPSHSRRVEGINYLFTEQAEWVDIKPIRALIREVRQKAGK